MKTTPDLRGVTELLNTLSQPPKVSYCPRCGSLLERRTATLFLNGKAETWDITLPFCFRCKLPLSETRP